MHIILPEYFGLNLSRIKLLWNCMGPSLRYITEILLNPTTNKYESHKHLWFINLKPSWIIT